MLAQPKPTALNAFERLYAIGNAQDKSYALSGFKKLAPERFAELIATLSTKTEEVEVMRGCIISQTDRSREVPILRAAANNALSLSE